ncbi:MAG: hypothetical protein M9887_09005 [Chitinophagales bacterium]|nr:hypothetical protein [Chitinophagales bacterium]
MNGKVIVVLIALLVQSCFFLLKAQDREDDVIILKLDHIDKDAPTTQKKIPSYLKKKRKNQIKMGLLSFIYGEIPLYYERYIRDFFTLQIGAGLTVRSFYADIDYKIQFNDQSLVYSSDYGVDNWTGAYEYDEPEDYHNYQYRKSSIGPYFSIAPRFYTGGNAFEGFYISPYLSYSINYYKIPNVDKRGAHLKSEGIFTEKIRNMHSGLTIGFQSQMDQITFDTYFSAGYKIMKGTRQDIGYYYKELDPIEYEYEYINRSLNYKTGRPYLRIDFILGYAWGKKNKSDKIK